MRGRAGPEQQVEEAEASALGTSQSSAAGGAPQPDADPEAKWLWQDSADSQRAHAILAAVLLLGAQPWCQQFKTGSIFYFAALAVTTIYIGSHKGLTTDLRQQLSVKEVCRRNLSFAVHACHLLPCIQNKQGEGFHCTTRVFAPFGI